MMRKYEANVVALLQDIKCEDLSRPQVNASYSGFDSKIQIPRITSGSTGAAVFCPSRPHIFIESSCKIVGGNELGLRFASGSSKEPTNAIPKKLKLFSKLDQMHLHSILELPIVNGQSEMKWKLRFRTCGIESSFLEIYVVSVRRSLEPRFAIVFSHLRVPGLSALVQSAFGLNKTESNLAIAVYATTNLKCAAGHCGLTYDSARTSLRRLCEKLGVASQLKVVKLIAMIDLTNL